MIVFIQYRSVRNLIDKVFIYFVLVLLAYVLEFLKVAYATGVGFLIMGFIGFFVKIIHIPINNILVGGMQIIFVVLNKQNIFTL